MAKRYSVNVQDLASPEGALGLLFDLADELNELLPDYKVSFIHAFGEDLIEFEKNNKCKFGTKYDNYALGYSIENACEKCE